MNRRDRLKRSSLYLCTDARRERGDLLDFVAATLDGGVDIVQLRDKGSPGEREFGALEAGPELDLLARLRELTTRAGALLAVNDRADIAAASGADVLHVGQDDLPPATARELVGDDVLIGLSSHDPAQAKAAAADPSIDYFCVGPCWATPTKPGRAGTGLDLVKHAAGLNTDRPWFAIGGIDLERAPEVAAAGASRIVVVRAITAADDPRAAAAALRTAIAPTVGTA
ncbi:MAG: thiamine phosphate synthase [Gordonia sp. (in: high G+C Gram-positive bacteria)]|uniref:thiamine phosphate synthase n=1 Tax=Gordonia sp. (in: high G+C Gram-positive bacteria) TaxID=84139 RepID=UPI0039E34831